MKVVCIRYDDVYAHCHALLNEEVQLPQLVSYDIEPLIDTMIDTMQYRETMSISHIYESSEYARFVKHVADFIASHEAVIKYTRDITAKIATLIDVYLFTHTGMTININDTELLIDNTVFCLTAKE
jgi:hypothetical protein